MNCHCPCWFLLLSNCQTLIGIFCRKWEYNVFIRETPIEQAANVNHLTFQEINLYCGPSLWVQQDPRGNSLETCCAFISNVMATQANWGQQPRVLCHSHPAALPLPRQQLHCSELACPSQLCPLDAEWAVPGVRKKEDSEGQKKTIESNHRVSEKAYETSVKQSWMYFLGCEVQSRKNLVPGWQITWGLQVLQVQAGEPGSSTETHKLNRFMGWFCSRHCQGQKGGGWATAAFGLAVWEMERQPSWNQGSSHQAWSLFSRVPGEAPTDKTQGEVTVSHLLQTLPLLYLAQGWNLVGEAVSFHHRAGVPAGSHPLRWQEKENYSKDKTPFFVSGTEKGGNPGRSWGLCPGSPSPKGVPHTLCWPKFALGD